ncbi:VF530 family protein [Aestuariirhabdus sp. Z084]|uniref:VF530 family protein n=1 Tax=Aestuariirhabdus haliotis TaxID=2918751 RepID=UPI0020C00EBC|nr:VF530 family protein [Aestuariirhabdus haliotis]MCL6417742.1 VF530 family protein [Aestuariirhabdus haliotis]
MSDDINYQNNPLHGLSLKTLLEELVDHYGFEILFAYLNINCFKTNPSIASSVKFLKKTDWAREKVEVFYLYTFKNLPKAASSQFSLSPRDRIIPDDQTPGEPKELSLEDAERLRELRSRKAAERGKGGPRQSGKPSEHRRHRSGNDRREEETRAKGWNSDRKNASDTPQGGRGVSDTDPNPAGDKVDPWARAKSRS